MPMPGGEGILPQLGQHSGGETLSLTEGIYRNAFKQIALARAGGDQFALVPYQYRPFHRQIGFQSGLCQKCLPYFQLAPLGDKT